MRVIDLIEDIETTSRRLHLRGLWDDSMVARMTGATLIRPDLVDWLQASIGPVLEDPAMRLAATVIRMAEVAHTPAPTCIFAEDFPDPLTPLDHPQRAYARRYDLEGFGAGGAGRLSLGLEQLAAGEPSEPDVLCAFSADGARIDALTAFVFGPLGVSTNAVVLAPTQTLEPLTRRWATAPGVRFAGVMIHADVQPYSCLHVVRRDRRD